ncbi:SRPBCC family protein [Aquidulcibacter sp.]|uniref:SRPBCC family protein n=1 Tax=Aquidulcibacter sp. TaxID=2052990 RepID=UPI0025BB7078|nr:SRPBCC family protein [Aquidulcibacter sp.]MCA3694024.1 SRPBCC family protein [Aquidulcibacter sp.]
MITHEVLIQAKPETVFALYQDVRNWPQWDEEVLEVSLPEGLTPNTRGWLKPRSGPKAQIKVVSVTQPTQFRVESGLPGCTMGFDHHLEATTLGTRVTHGVYFKGPTSFLFKRLIGPSLRRGLPVTLQGLKNLAEAAGP